MSDRVTNEAQHMRWIAIFYCRRERATTNNWNITV